MTATLTPRQQERRDAVVRAAVDLVAEKGVDELQMRAVCERSGVALATVYRYFPSKDQLAAVAFLEWASTLESSVAIQLPEGDPADRLVDVLRRGIRPFRRQPNFAQLMIFVSSSRDPLASETYLRLGTIIRGTMARAIPDVDEDVRERVLQAIGSIWYHCTVEWVAGRIDVDEALRRVESAARLMLPAGALTNAS